MRPFALLGLLVLTLPGSAAAEMLATDDTNPNFNRFLAAQDLPVCQPGTYFSFLESGAEEYAAPRDRTAARTLTLFEDYFSEGRQVLRKVAGPESLTLYVQSVDGTYEVYKETYIDGYTLWQNCQVNPAGE